MKKQPSKKTPPHPAARKKRDRVKKAAISGSGKRSSPKRIVGIRELCDVIHLRERRIYGLRHEGLPRISPGRYDVGKVCRWYIAYLTRKIAERANPPENSTDAAGVIKHKMLSIESELKAIELAEKRERLISAERVRKDVKAILAEIRRRVLAVAPEIARGIAGERDIAVSQVKIDRALKSVLEGLSQYDPDEAAKPGCFEVTEA